MYTQLVEDRLGHRAVLPLDRPCRCDTQDAARTGTKRALRARGNFLEVEVPQR